VRNHMLCRSHPERVKCLTVAARFTGISDPILRRLVRAGRLTVFADPVDEQRKLVCREEVEWLFAGGASLAAGKESADVT
jgi:hypothetical protein